MESILKTVPWQESSRPALLVNGDYELKMYTAVECVPVIKISSTKKTFVLSVTLEVVKGIVKDGFDVCAGHRKKLHVPLWSSGFVAGDNTQAVSGDYIRGFCKDFITAFSDICPDDVLFRPETCGFKKDKEYVIPDPFPFYRLARGTYHAGEGDTADKWSFTRVEEKNEKNVV